MNYFATRTGEVLSNIQQEADGYQVENSGLDNTFIFGTIGGMLFLGVSYAILDRKVKYARNKINNQTQLNNPETDIN